MSIQLKITAAVFLIALAGMSVQLAAQVDIANVELNFDSPVATSNANVTKYNDVFTANGTEYDALITLESLTGGSITSADNTSSSQGNQARYFSPRFSWNSGGGSAVYLVQFIEDDTEDDPQLVTFLNFSVNSYDLDGGVSGSGAAGQFSSFSNFDSYTLGDPTDLNVMSSGELTKFQCGVNVSSSAADIENWVKTTYTSVSTFEFAVGASGSGAAYYFIDFSEGTFAGNSNVTVTENPVNVTFSSFDPTSACAGDTLFLSGENFFAVDAVEVGGESASDYLLAASDSMWVVVPAITGTPTDEVTVYNNSTPTAVSGFSFAVDSDGDGVCDNEDNCTDTTACNYDGSVTNAACVYPAMVSWDQQGGDIDGEAAGDGSGSSVSLSSDGMTVAIGAISNNGINSGHVRIYAWNSTTSAWDQQGGDINGEAAGDQSGTSVSLSSDGTTVAIGAPYNDVNGNNSGHVRIYAWNSGTGSWVQQGGDIDGEAAGDESGRSVSLSADGETVAIGAPFNDGNGHSSGHVRIYAWNGDTGSWDQQGGDIDGEAAEDRSGWSVSLSSDGTTVAIGATNSDGNGSDAGHVRIYAWNSDTESWDQQGGDIDGEAAGDYSGSVSLSSDGETVAIGSIWNDGNGSNSGHVRIYAWNSDTGSWDQQGGDIDGEAAGDKSGSSVSLSSDGTTVAIGAYGNDGNGSNSGHVRIYAWNGDTGFWEQQGSDIDGEAADDGSGWSASLSSDGETVAIGATLNDANGSNSGHVRIYALNSNPETAWYADTDGDGLGDPSDGQASCTQPAGYVSNSSDLCDDTTACNYDATTTTNAACTYATTWYADVDGDGLGDPNDSQSACTQPAGYVSDSSDLCEDTTACNYDGTVTNAACVYPAMVSWDQQGGDIDGEAAGDKSGWSVSLSSDGTTVAIGAPRNAGNGNNSGHVRIYAWNSDTGTWDQQGSDIEGEAAEDRSGSRVSLSADGNTVAIGSAYNDGNGSSSGHVRIYVWNSGTESWDQQGSDIDGEAVYDNSGYSVSLSSDGTIVAIGAYGNDDNGHSSGHVRIYAWNSTTNSWDQQGGDIDGEAASDHSGRSVSLSSDGQTVAIGARTNDGNGSNSGHVRIHAWNSDTGSWDQQGSDIDGEAAEDRSGYSVSLSSDGETVAIGALFNDGNGGKSGHVRIYAWNSGTESWDQQGGDIDGEAAYDQSGYSVSLSSDGETVAIGAKDNDGNGINSGHVRIYAWNSGTSAWDQQGLDIDSEAAGDFSGYSVSLSSDGETVAIGAPYNAGNGSNSGHVRIYALNSNPETAWYADTDGDGLGDPSDGQASCTQPAGYVSNSSDLCDDITACNYDATTTANAACTYATTWYADVDGDGLGDSNDSQSACTQPSGYVSDSSDLCEDTTACNYDGSVTNAACTYPAMVSWDQQGGDIDGEAELDLSGQSVSLSSDGMTVAIGAKDNDGNGDKSGHVRIYAWNSATSAWDQKGVDIDGEAAGDESGTSVSLSSDGTTVAIGASGNDGNGNNSGHVRIYVWDGTTSTWVQRGADIDGEAAGDQSGQSVSLSSDGETVAIGAGTNEGNGSYSGHVRIYVWNSGTGSWDQQGSDIDGEAAGDASGWRTSLSSDGETVAIGAPYNAGNGSNSGHVRIYTWNSNTGSWDQQGGDIDGEAASDYSGQSVSLSSDGETVAIGAMGNNGGNGSFSGHVRIYAWNGDTGSWIQQGGDIDAEAAYDQSGSSVSLSSDGQTVAIGAPYNDDSGNKAGHVRIYAWNSGTESWVQHGGDIDGEATFDSSGSSVSLSSDGTTVAIGAGQNNGNGSWAGHVRIYALNSNPETAWYADTDGDGLGDPSDGQASCTQPAGYVSNSSDLCDDTTACNYDATTTTNAACTYATTWYADIDGDGLGDSNDSQSACTQPSGYVSDSSDLCEDTTACNYDGTVTNAACVYPAMVSWDQQGGDIDGEAVGDWSGSRVSLSSDGQTVAIGAAYNDGNGDKSGHVRIYAWNSGTGSWDQQGSDIDGEAAEDGSGLSASLSSDGTTVAIGAYGNDGNGNNSGHVRIYAWNSDTGSWDQQGSDIDGEAAEDGSGSSVSLSADGKTVAIGAMFNDGNGTDSGHVRIYAWNSGTGSWDQQGGDIDGEAAGDESGSSVSLSSDGTTIAIGAIWNDDNGNKAGHVRIYAWNSGTGSWDQQGGDIDGEAEWDFSGFSVSLSSDGETVAIGAIGNNGGTGSYSGHVRIYAWNGDTGSWIQQGGDIDAEAAFDNSGSSVSLSSDGETVAIGARYNDGNGDSSGHVRIYAWNSGTSAWDQQGVDIDGEAAGDESGSSVSLSSDGTTVAIGARWNDGNGGSSGHVRIYALNSNPETAWYADTDGDGLGDPSDGQASCTQPAGYVSNSSDLCDDNTACNYDATTTTNAACTYATTWYADVDGDGLGDSNDSQSACTQPAGYVSDNSDLCEDTTACNYDGSVTNAACTYPTTWYADVDGDGLGDPSDGQASCTQPAGYVSNSSDLCDDTTACNYDATTTTNAVCTYATTWYADTDGDGLGDSSDSQSACTQPAGYVSDSSDLCDDTTACNYDANPTEACAANDACGVCGGSGVDSDSDGVCDDVDLCTDTTACNYDANPTAACAANDACGVCGGSGVDSDSDGVCDDVDLCTDTTACNYDANPTEACAANDACGVCGGSGVDSDSDGVCDDVDLCTDTTACNYDANPTEACAANDACGVCGGSGTDTDADGVCDEVDLCTDPTANNYTADPTEPCDFGVTFNVVDTIMGCEAQTDAIALDLDTLHSGTGSWTYSITQELTGFASSTLSGSTLSIDFSPSGADSARVNVSGTNNTDNADIEILVIEGTFPYWNSTAPDGGNEPTSPTGGMTLDLGGAYGAPVTVHYYENAVLIEAPSGNYGVDAFGQELTAMTDSSGALISLPSGDYWIRGYTNQFGCFNPEPATSGTPTSSPQLRLLTVPHLLPE